jgi:hypothetical protein
MDQTTQSPFPFRASASLAGVTGVNMELPTGRTILTPVAPDKTMNAEKEKG